MITVSMAILLLAQGTGQTAPLPNPYGNPARVQARTAPATHVRQVRTHLRGRQGAWIGGMYREAIVEAPAPPPPPDPLKELVISPVYQREKFTPKMIEIP